MAVTRTLNPIQTSAPQQSNPYATGLQTEFSYTGKDKRSGNLMRPRTSREMWDTSTSEDADVREAQRLTNELAAARVGNNSGMDQAAGGAQLNMLRSRIALKNALGQSIADNPMQEKAAEDDVRSTAYSALDSGLKNTKQNYNSRGLLYSGLREGGEQKVRSNVASQLSSGLANTKREYENAANSAKNAYASIGLASQQEALNRANQAFETANANSIARMQAMQQLGSGLGSAAGYYFGSRGSSSVSPDSNSRQGLVGLTNGFE